MPLTRASWDDMYSTINFWRSCVARAESLPTSVASRHPSLLHRSLSPNSFQQTTHQTSHFSPLCGYTKPFVISLICYSLLMTPTSPAAKPPWRPIHESGQCLMDGNVQSCLKHQEFLGQTWHRRFPSTGTIQTLPTKVNNPELHNFQ